MTKIKYLTSDLTLLTIDLLQDQILFEAEIKSIDQTQTQTEVLIKPIYFDFEFSERDVRSIGIEKIVIKKHLTNSSSLRKVSQNIGKTLVFGSDSLWTVPSVILNNPTENYYYLEFERDLEASTPITTSQTLESLERDDFFVPVNPIQKNQTQELQDQAENIKNELDDNETKQTLAIISYLLGKEGEWTKTEQQKFLEQVKLIIKYLLAHPEKEQSSEICNFIKDTLEAFPQIRPFSEKNLTQENIQNFFKTIKHYRTQIQEIEEYKLKVDKGYKWFKEKKYLIYFGGIVLAASFVFLLLRAIKQELNL